MAIQDNVFYSELPNLSARPPEDVLSHLERDFFGDISIPQLMSNYSRLDSTPSPLPLPPPATVTLQLQEREPHLPARAQRQPEDEIGTYSTLERTSVGAHYEVQGEHGDIEEDRYAQLSQHTRTEPPVSHYESPINAQDKSSAARLLRVSPLPPQPSTSIPTDADAHYRAVHRFVPRHTDEIELLVGDRLVLLRLHVDLWAECKNKRTGLTGVVPNHYIVHTDEHSAEIKSTFVKETFSANFIGFVSVKKSSGREVAREAMTRILSERRRMGITSVQPVMVEVTGTGVTTHVIETTGGCVPKIPPIHFSINQVTYTAIQGTKSLAYITRDAQQLGKYTCYVYETDESVEIVLGVFQKAFDTYKKSKSALTKSKDQSTD